MVIASLQALNQFCPAAFLSHENQLDSEMKKGATAVP